METQARQAARASTPLNDGYVAIYRVTNGAAAGDKPTEVLTALGTLRYARRTVGIRRYYAAMEAGAQIDLLLRVPYRREVSAQDVAVPTLDGRQYRVELIQVVEGSAPPVMDLTLRRLERDYRMGVGDG